MQNQKRFLKVPVVAEMLNMHPQSIRRMAAAGTFGFPKIIRLSPRTSVFSESEIMAYIESRKASA